MACLFVCLFTCLFVCLQEERIKHERRLINWERLYSKVMEVKSHGRRWKFRIEPLKKKLERDGYEIMSVDVSKYMLHVASVAYDNH